MTDAIEGPCLKIGVCKVEGCKYHRKVDFDDKMLISVARRMSFSHIFVQHSMAWVHDSFGKLPIRLTLSNVGIMAVILAVLMPRSFTYMLVYPIFRLIFGTLYPAYASYKGIRTKNVKEYVKWMMYWIVFALFTCAETFTDVFFSFWFPFYYEIKIILVLWLLSPATNGSSILYRRFVHPALSRREAEIDEALARATEQGYTTVLHLGSRGVNYATTVLMQTAIKGGGGLVQQLRKSYSLSDLTGEKEDENRNTPNSHDETDMEVEPCRRERVGRRGYSPRRTQSTHNRVDMYFSEVDVEVRQPRAKEPLVSLNNIRSSEDISSGYSSGEALHNHRGSTHSEALVRTASVGGRTRVKSRSTTKKAPEEEEKDPDHNSLLFRDQLPLPDPLTFLSAEQALELLSFLSHHLAYNNFININKNFFKSEDSSDAQSTGMNVKFFISGEEYKEKKVEDEISILNENIASSIPKVVKFETNESETHKKSSTEIEVGKLTDDICKEKFDELKKLLRDAHKAVSNIVSSQESLSKYDSDEENIPSLKKANVDTTHGNNLVKTYGSINTLEVWSTPNISRSNSDSELRAGKYHKRPAPKAPTSKCAEDLEEVGSQKALKATLVIKTGTLKSFTDSRDSKKSSSRKPNKIRTKDGFSKLLTIPKNIFHSAFHKDQKEKARYDDSSSATSDCSVSRSRLSSIGSENTLTDDKTLTTSKELNTEKYITKNERSKTEEKSDDNQVLGLQNEMTECAKTVERSDEKSSGNSEIYRERFRIRQMSHSPTRGIRKTLTDENN